MSPCENCKRKPNCPEKCKPRMDWARHQKRLKRKSKE